MQASMTTSQTFSYSEPVSHFLKLAVHVLFQLAVHVLLQAG
jgi:hypothetical protein